MKIRRILIAVICFAILFASIISPTALAAAQTDYDYSREGSYFNTTLTSADILELLGYELSDGERAYLAKYATLSVKYEVIASTQDIHVTTTDDVTRVSASPYSYVANNGDTVTWTPVMASIAGESREMTLLDGAYYADFTGISLNDDSSVDVKYAMSSIFIESEDINAILNLAYDDAVPLKEEITLYRENADAVTDYYASIDRYSQYVSDKLVYDQKKGVYDKYLEDYALYEEQYARYEDYLADLEKFNTDYEIYSGYDAVYAKYESDLTAYNKYLSDLAFAGAQIKMIDDGLFGKASHLNRQIYSCIFASLVDEVVERRDQLTKVGAKKADIDACNEATTVLRAILKPEGGVAYADLKTTEEKYAFYVNNYEALRDNIIKLTLSLHNIFSTDGVLATMHIAASMFGRPNYTEKLAIFIAQLVYFSNALSDEPIMTKNGKAVLDGNLRLDYREDIEGGYIDREDVTLYDILEGNVFVEDISDPNPITLVEKSEPTHPGEKPEEPTAPEKVNKPVAPAVVADPGAAPEVVPAPVRPEWLPEDISRLEIVNDETYLLLISALDSGLLDSHRDELTEDYELTPTVTLEKKLNVTDMVEVRFLDTDGTLISSVCTEKGTAVNFTDTLPTKGEDITATYVFDRWVDADGVPYELSSVTEDATLYPSFKPIYKDYPVVDNGYKYLLIPADGELESFPLAHFLNTAKPRNLGLILTSEDVTVTVSYATVLDLLRAGASTLSVNADVSALDSYSCEVLLYGTDGEMMAGVSGISVSLPCSDEIFGRDSELCYRDSEGAVHNTGKTYGNGNITFNATAGVRYYFSLKYEISANSNLAGKVSFPTEAMPGETVVLDIEIPAGTVAVLYYSVYPNLSEKTVIEGDSFVMPYGDVRLSATFTELEYTVRFVSDGKVISEKSDYKYGDTVKVPNTPIKLSDGQYTYTFIGWSSEITEVTADVTYVAQFEATLIPVVKEKVSTFNVIFYTGLTLFILFAVSLVLFILNRKGIISIRGVLSFMVQKLTRIAGKLLALLSKLTRLVAKLFSRLSKKGRG